MLNIFDGMKYIKNVNIHEFVNILKNLKDIRELTHNSEHQEIKEKITHLS